MNDNTTITVELSISQIQSLNNIISNSTPTVPFGVVSQLVADINVQIKQQLENLQKETAPVEPPVLVEAE